MPSNLTGGEYNTAYGNNALALAGNGSDYGDYLNTAVGAGALQAQNNSSGNNTAVGAFSLSSNTSGSLDTTVGNYASADNTTGSYNVAMGYSAMQANQNGSNNEAIGASALASCGSRGNTCSNNIAIGVNSAFWLQSGSNEIYVGYQGPSPGPPVYTYNESNVIHIGTQGTQTSTFIAGIYGAQTVDSDAVPVLIDDQGNLGTVSSSRRYKEDIEPMGDASDRLLKLRPVTFRYRRPYASGAKPIQFGLIAEEVAEVFPELVVYNKGGAPETVKYQLLDTLLLNELQKEHRVIEQQEQRLVAMKAQLEEVNLLRAEVATLQRLTAQLNAAANGTSQQAAQVALTR